MALNERTAAGILAGDANRNALGGQRSERGEFREAPVDAAVDGHVCTALEQGLELRVNMEALRDFRVSVTDSLDELRGDRGVVCTWIGNVGVLSLSLWHAEGTVRADCRHRGCLSLVGLRERGLEQ